MTRLAEAARTSHVALNPRPGLLALEAADRPSVKPDDPRAIEGSVNLDEDLRALHPHAPRWDYAVGYAGSTWFIEVHPASGDANVNEVVAKAKWLRATFGATPLHTHCRGYWWVASGNVSSHPAFARRKRALALAGVQGPVRTVRLTVAPATPRTPPPA